MRRPASETAYPAGPGPRRASCQVRSVGPATLQHRHKPCTRRCGTGFVCSPVPVLGVVPARLGASCAPRKPLRLLAGDPLILWVLRRLTDLRVCDRVVVATDSDEVASVVERARGDHDTIMATATQPKAEGTSADLHRRMLRQMVLVRRFEEKTAEAYALGRIGGF